MIFQETFKFIDGVKSDELDAKIIPCSITSQPTTNNFQPTPLVEKDKERVLERLKKYSKGRNIEIDAEGRIKPYRVKKLGQ